MFCTSITTGRRFFTHCWHDDGRKWLRGQIKDCNEGKYIYLGVLCFKHCCRCMKTVETLRKSTDLSMEEFNGIAGEIIR